MTFRLKYCWKSYAAFSQSFTGVMVNFTGYYHKLSMTPYTCLKVFAILHVGIYLSKINLSFIHHMHVHFSLLIGKIIAKKIALAG